MEIALSQRCILETLILLFLRRPYLNILDERLIWELLLPTIIPNFYIRPSLRSRKLVDNLLIILDHHAEWRGELPIVRHKPLTWSILINVLILVLIIIPLIELCRAINHASVLIHYNVSPMGWSLRSHTILHHSFTSYFFQFLVWDKLLLVLGRADEC